MDAWKHVATNERIVDGCRQCGQFDFDVSIGKLQSKLCETIKNREVPYNIVKEK